jgi:hypothetical protein
MKGRVLEVVGAKGLSCSAVQGWSSFRLAGVVSALYDGAPAELKS